MLFTPEQSPCELYSAAQVRGLDAALIAGGISGFTLMQRAAQAAWMALQQRWSQPRQVDVLVGGGNNAGDGYLLASLAQQAGYDVRVFTLVEPANLTGDARLAWLNAQEHGVLIESWSAQQVLRGILVDGLLGTGVRGTVRESYQAVISDINGSGLPVLALDLPSGVCADTGQVLGCAVRADLTVSFIAWKLGLFTGAAVECVGELLLAPLAERPAHWHETPLAQRLLPKHLAVLPVRGRNAHKGQFGRVLVVGGEQGTAGAALLTAQAALRSGAGLVFAATRPENTQAFIARCPEVMAQGISSANQLMPLLEQADVVLVGPGLGQGPWARSLISAVANSEALQVWDADALNLLAQGLVSVPKQCLMTPHPGEAARLLDCSIAQVQGDRPAAARALAERFKATVVLKGAGSLIATQERHLFICDRGHPVMAGAGLGDVLTGMMGALLAQGLTAQQAAPLAVWLHAVAGEHLAAAGRGLAASDLLPPVRQLLEEISPCLS